MYRIVVIQSYALQNVPPDIFSTQLAFLSCDFSWNPKEGEPLPSRMVGEWVSAQSCWRCLMQAERRCL